MKKEKSQLQAEVEKQALEEKKVEYMCRETGAVLTDLCDIAYYKIKQHDQIIENILLGQFNQDGHYFIDKPLLLELVKIKKYVLEHYDNKYILTTKISEFGELKFTILIEQLEQDKLTATLRFIEIITKEDDGEEREILRTIVAKYKDDNDQYFLEKVFKAFNISKEPFGDGKEIDDEELLYILKRMRALAKLKKLRVESLDYISNTYVDEILAILKKHPCKFSEYILRKYLEFLESMKNMVGKPKYFIKLRKFLDKLIASALSKETDPAIVEAIKKVRKDFCENYENINGKILTPPAPAKPKAKDGAKKSSAGASGGGKKKAKGKSKAKGGGKKGGKASSKKQQYYFEHKPLEEDKKTEKKPEKKPEEKKLVKEPKRVIKIFEDDVFEDFKSKAAFIAETTITKEKTATVVSTAAVEAVKTVKTETIEQGMI